ncbi:MAG: hypothetical protein ACKO4W_12280, partial [Bacteroidota bacterium]
MFQVLRKETEQIAHGFSEILPVHYQIYKSILEQKFRSLESLRKVSFYCFTNYSRTGETDECLRFIGGSMGSVVGEKISLAIDHALESGSALMIISKSGGARMMESAFSLMQMA